MEGDGVAFAFPLVAAPEFVEFDDPFLHVFFGMIGVVAEGEGHGGFGAFFVTDGGALDAVEDVVGHEVAFVGLFVFFGTEFGGGLLFVDEAEGRIGAGFFEAGAFHPAEPAAEEVFIDASDGADAA